jgi:hypothetical protein
MHEIFTAENERKEVSQRERDLTANLPAGRQGNKDARIRKELNFIVVNSCTCM